VACLRFQKCFNQVIFACWLLLLGTRAYPQASLLGKEGKGKKGKLEVEDQGHVNRTGCRGRGGFEPRLSRCERLGGRVVITYVWEAAELAY